MHLPHDQPCKQPRELSQWPFQKAPARLYSLIPSKPQEPTALSLSNSFHMEEDNLVHQGSAEVFALGFPTGVHSVESLIGLKVKSLTIQLLGILGNLLSHLENLSLIIPISVIPLFIHSQLDSQHSLQKFREHFVCEVQKVQNLFIESTLASKTNV